ncbi:Dephospho-CoA kinase [Coemansia sp. RSA 455]|nr:Dephospho-CoA kinase [Coemansia sp. S17]KAJ2037065.1 Dephospho-CoA kinase [Coemansia sp. S3946]KAJ2050102.1 Dephospho-CoA kinase [Coemansia sp. S16]KAJ2065843.1 Dephospho-CoA kinase [Coemansia sp. S2]KAJ2099868.1 Dephospho-CoA kinase [Coemansia sp. S100]KAJ2249528.1 Dephospho-CoA kinase [Coemansia sp. RSA 455]
MLIVGLTGGIATGKSTASQAFRARGVPVIDADVIAHQIMEPGEVSYNLILQQFGEDVLQKDTKAIDRGKLGSIVFNDSDKRQTLNRCTHPYVRRRILYQLLGCYLRGYPMCVLDVPLLYESGMDKMCGKVVVVSCTGERQIVRLMDRNGFSREEAEARVKSQMPIEEKERRAARVLDNNKGLTELERQVDDLVEKWTPSLFRTWGALLAPVGIVVSLPFARLSTLGFGTLCTCAAWIAGSLFIN